MDEQEEVSNGISSCSTELFQLYLAFLWTNAISQLVNIYTLAVSVPSIAVGVRKIHDAGKNGWFLLIPIYNLIIAFTDGIYGDNEYGADPKAIV